jgi:hypothetical protein
MYNLIKNLTTKEEVKKVLRANDAGASLEKSLTDRWLAEKEAADIAAEQKTIAPTQNVVKKATLAADKLVTTKVSEGITEYKMPKETDPE